MTEQRRRGAPTVYSVKSKRTFYRYTEAVQLTRGAPTLLAKNPELVLSYAVTFSDPTGWDDVKML